MLSPSVKIPLRQQKYHYKSRITITHKITPKLRSEIENIVTKSPQQRQPNN